MPGTEQGAPLLEPEFMRRLERLMLVSKRVQRGAAKGERRSRRKGASVEFADYRDYVQGDDLRHVDWNLYARLEQLHLKLFEDTEDLALHIMLDTSRSMAYGTPAKFAFARQLAAAVGYVGLAGYDRVGVSAFSGAGARVFGPARGRASARRLFAFLETLEPAGATQLDAACRGLLPRARARGVTVLISDFFDEGGHEQAVRRLAAGGGALHAVQVLAPEELNPELSGDLKLVDSETGRAVEVSVSPALLRQYARNRDAFTQGLHALCTARGAGHYLVSSGAPLERTVLDVLRRGGLLA